MSKLSQIIAAECFILRKWTHLLSDEFYLKVIYKLMLGKKLNLVNPTSFNEKLQWLKLNNRNSFYSTLVDKAAVKQWAAEIIGAQYIIPTFGVWDKYEDIDFDKLPNQFVLKCTHDSGSYVICKDKMKLDVKATRKKFVSALKRNFYYLGREWPYKNVPPRIIAEKYLEDKNGAFVDYKFTCFDGYVDNVMVCLDRHINDVKFYFFDKDWNLKRLNVRGKNAPEGFTIPKPSCMDKMFEMASKLSKGIPFVRVDLFECDGNIYFGEMTFFPDCGFDANLLPETDLYFGSLIDLNKITRR